MGYFFLFIFNMMLTLILSALLSISLAHYCNYSYECPIGQMCAENFCWVRRGRYVAEREYFEPQRSLEVEASRGGGGWGRPNTNLERPGRDFFDFEASRGGWGKPNIKLEKPGREMYASRGGW